MVKSSVLASVAANGNIMSDTAEAEKEEEYDYEALPRNTSLSANLMAGAFAGIMVRYAVCSPCYLLSFSEGRVSVHPVCQLVVLQLTEFL